MGGGKERVAPGCLSPGASLRVVGVFYRRMGDMRAGLGVALVGLVVCVGCGSSKSPHPQEKAIAAIEGVDVIMLGSADFSVLSGIPGQFDHPSIEKSLNKIAQAAANTGKYWASTAADANSAKELLQRGAGMILHNADICIVKKGLEIMQADFSKLGFQFQDNPI